MQERAFALVDLCASQRVQCGWGVCGQQIHCLFRGVHEGKTGTYGVLAVQLLSLLQLTEHCCARAKHTTIPSGRGHTDAREV